MKKLLIILAMIGFTVSSCNIDKSEQDNPLLGEFNTPYNVPPFDKIETSDYMPAFKEAIKLHDAEINAIVENKENATFKNTIEALDRAGKTLGSVSGIFFNVNESDTNEEFQKIAEEVSPLLSKHSDNISLNEKLFQRVKSVYEQKETLELDIEQARLLEETFKGFSRSGANLNDVDKNKLRKINEELSVLTLKFGQNVLAETNNFKLVIENKKDLEGLPQSVIDAAAETANATGDKGKWTFTIQKPSLIPFLTYSSNRDLRKSMFKAYINKGNNGDSLDNKNNINSIAKLRLQKAKLLGYKTWANFILDENMAKTPENVYGLLNKIWEPAIKAAKQEAKELQKMINKEGDNFKLEPWDWRYYSEKVRKEKYNLDEEQLRPYFKLENVIDGIFYTANHLYGLQFKEITNIPKYNKEVKTYEVRDADGSLLGIQYMDFFPRASKRGGAWMTGFRKEYKENGKRIIPLISLVTNFTKPTADKPSLLSFDEVTTLFHEFGHSLHGLLTQCTYKKISGTDVARDFVEFPSQINENWASQPEVLKEYAKHYKTGETIPMELVQKMINSSHFNQGFVTVEYLAACYLDLDWHTITEEKQFDVNAFEKASMDKLGLIPEIVVRYRSTYYNHVFSGGYSAGYYSYIWADVLVADAFAYFKENGIFNEKISTSLRKNIIEQGNTEDQMIQYKRFRGQEPEITPLLKQRGLLK
ncbi:MAG: M3 family metallopeptidase [Bacteroidetes bacterium]|nr:M3 family metallopeptidase [Bacteroidota bacterium]